MVTIGELFDPTGFSVAHTTAAQDGLEALRSGLPCDWAALDNSFDAFLAFRELDEADKAAWLAFAVSQSLQASLATRSEEHTSELQSLMRTSYVVFCFKKKKYTKPHQYHPHTLPPQ